MTPLLWFAVATSAVWLLAARRCPEARPIAAGLALVTLIDIARLAGLPARWNMALWLLHPAVSAWCVRTVLTPSPWIYKWLDHWLSFVYGVAAVALIQILPSAGRWWAALPAFAWGAAVMSEAWSVASWWRRGRSASLPVAAALVLAGIDLATIAELGAGADAWWFVQIAGWISWGLMLAIGLLIWKVENEANTNN